MEKALQDIEKATDKTIKSFANKKGRLIYIGAGRLGILDASECPCPYLWHKKITSFIYFNS